MTMARKVEGYYTMAHDGTPLVHLEKNVYFTKHCTTVLHEGEPERVFTESEVRAVLRDFLSAAEDGPYIPNYERMDEVAKSHGFAPTKP
jgi:hypothetical protein